MHLLVVLRGIDNPLFVGNVLCDGKVAATK